MSCLLHEYHVTNFKKIRIKNSIYNSEKPVKLHFLAKNKWKYTKMKTMEVLCIFHLLFFFRALW